MLPVVVDNLTRQGVNDALVLDSPSSDAYDVCDLNRLTLPCPPLPSLALPSWM